jgi:hypothetical protein
LSLRVLPPAPPGRSGAFGQINRHSGNWPIYRNLTWGSPFNHPGHLD